VQVACQIDLHNFPNIFIRSNNDHIFADELSKETTTLCLHFRPTPSAKNKGKKPNTVARGLHIAYCAEGKLRVCFTKPKHFKKQFIKNREISI